MRSCVFARVVLCILSFFQHNQNQTRQAPMKFFDSSSGKLLFVAPRGRSMKQFLDASKQKSFWLSFTELEIVKDHVRKLPTGEIVSVDGMRLGHYIQSTWRTTDTIRHDMSAIHGNKNTENAGSRCPSCTLCIPLRSVAIPLLFFFFITSHLFFLLILFWSTVRCLHVSFSFRRWLPG